MEDVKIIKKNGRFPSQVVFLESTKGGLPKDDYKSFNLGDKP